MAFVRKMKAESGYSLVEVMASILILSIAIIPMVGMFDAGLKASQTSGSYDTARSFANTQLERAKGLTYSQVKENYPLAAPATAAMTSGSYVSSSPIAAAAAPHQVPSGFGYEVTKQFMRLNPTLSPGQMNLENSATDQGIVKVTVTVKWSGGAKTYSASGVVFE